MYKVRVPATSANVGSGFDVLGIAFDLFNEYSFKRSSSFSLKGFAPKYLDLNKNLVLSSYRKAFEYANKQPIEVEINEIRRDIPRAGGLGSSAACVVAGILGANYFMDGKLSLNEILELATSIDGHPDNVSAVIFGGLTACYKSSNGYLAEKYNVSSNLKFMICYPNFFVSTEMARSVLPKNIEVSKVVENMSRIVNLPRAFEKGDINLLKECVKDNLHEPYRIKLIDEGSIIKSVALDCGAIAVISGSGATMLVISDNCEALEKVKAIKTKNKWTFKEVNVYFGE